MKRVKGKLKAEDPEMDLLLWIRHNKSQVIHFCFMPDGNPTAGIYRQKGEVVCFCELPMLDNLLLDLGSFVLIAQKILRYGGLISATSEKLAYQGLFE